VNVRSVSLPPTQLQRAMELGEVDLAMGYFPDLKGNNFYQQRLYAHGFVCLVRAGHPVKGPRLTMKQFKQLGHAVVRAEGRSQEIFERFLLKRGIQRRETLQTPHFMSIPHIIAHSDLVATVPMAVGTSFAKFMDIRLILPPFDVPQVDIRQHWHRKFHHDPQNRWLRGVVHTLINESMDELKG
jgi:DNA-binding transcriptional LysR family regulator